MHPPVRDTIRELRLTRVARKMALPISTVFRGMTQDRIPGKGRAHDGRIPVARASGPRLIERYVRDPDDARDQRRDLRSKIRELERQRESLRCEVERLHQERLQLAPSQSLGIAEVVECFLAELEHAGYCIDGDPVTPGDLLSDRRAAAWARPRMVAMWLAASIARGASLPQVAHFFGRD